MIIGAGFFIFLMTWVWPEKVNITTAIFPALFGLFALLCLSLAIGFKVYYLTQSDIIITIPVVFYKHTVSLGDIKNLTDSDVLVDFNNKSFVPDKTKIGRKVIVLLNDGKSLEISSLQVGGYKKFRENLRSALINQGRKRHQ
jgi:hypothetical protein